jgi:hypothetical protein
MSGRIVPLLEHLMPLVGGHQILLGKASIRLGHRCRQELDKLMTQAA